jgi:hypothetical protein
MSSTNEVSEMKEVAEKGTKLYEGGGSWEEYANYAAMNCPAICTAFLESIKRIEELEKDKARLDALEDEAHGNFYTTLSEGVKSWVLESTDDANDGIGEGRTLRSAIDDLFGLHQSTTAAALPKGGE